MAVRLLETRARGLRGTKGGRMTDTAASSGQRAADENAKRAVRLLNGGPEETPGTLAAATLQPCRAAPGPRARVSGAALGPDPRPRPRPRVLGS